MLKNTGVGIDEVGFVRLLVGPFSLNLRGVSIWQHLPYPSIEKFRWGKPLTESRLEKTGLSSVRVLARVVNRRSPTCRVITLFLLVVEGVEIEL